MQKRIYNHLNFYPKNSNIKFSGTGRGKPNIPERPDDYYKQKREELEKIKIFFMRVWTLPKAI